MKRWWADTLFKRLFLLMWLALVASHLVAFLMVTQWAAGPGPHARPLTLANAPTLPSLPPTPGLPQMRPPPPGGSDPQGPPVLPVRLLLLDYGVRL